MYPIDRIVGILSTSVWSVEGSTVSQLIHRFWLLQNIQSVHTSQEPKWMIQDIFSSLTAYSTWRETILLTVPVRRKRSVDGGAFYLGWPVRWSPMSLYWKNIALRKNSTFLLFKELVLSDMQSLHGWIEDQNHICFFEKCFYFLHTNFVISLSIFKICCFQLVCVRCGSGNKRVQQSGNTISRWPPEIWKLEFFQYHKVAVKYNREAGTISLWEIDGKKEVSLLSETPQKEKCLVRHDFWPSLDMKRQARHDRHIREDGIWELTIQYCHRSFYWKKEIAGFENEGLET